MNCVYVFQIHPEKDSGPFEHIRAIAKYFTAGSLSSVSSVPSAKLSGFKESIYIPYSEWNIVRRFSLNTMVFQFGALIPLIWFKFKYGKTLIVLQRQSMGFFIPAVFAKICGIRFISEVNGLLTQDLKDRGKGSLLKIINFATEKITYMLSSKIIVVDDNLTSFLSRRYSLPLEKFHVVNNGTHPRKWVSSLQAKSNVGIQECDFWIGYLGSLSHREGVDLLLGAISKIRDPNLKLKVVGGRGVELETLKKQAALLGISERVVFTGSLPYEKALCELEVCELFIHLRRKILRGKSDSQGSPLKMLDYHNVGRFVVASKITSYNYIESKGFGYLVDPENQDEIVGAIERAIANRQRNIEFGKSAHEYIIREKTWERSVRILEGILEG